MIWLRRFFRILKYTVLIALAFAVGALAVLTLTPKGRENLAGLISDFASTPDRQVRISGINGIWSGNFSLDQLVLEDSEGPWLAVRGVEVDWSPTSLLWLRFDADRIAAERVEFARLPKPSAEPAPTKSGSGSLPVDVSIGALDFPDIALGQSVTGGQVASIAAKGKAMAQASPLTVNADLTVSRTDGTAGEVLAAIDFAPQDNKLDIDLKASEPSGGILANLLGLPGKPAVDIIVTGSGPLANWTGNGTFAVDGNLVTSVSATHRQTDAGNVVEAKGDGVFDRFLPERFRPLLAGKADFDLAGTLTKAGGIEIARAKIDSGALGVTGTGSYDPQGLTDIALELAAKNNGVPLSFGTDESPIDIVIGSASVRALGDGRHPGLDISAKLPSVSTRDVKLSDLGITLHSDEFDVAARSGPVTGAATASSLAIDNPTVAPLVAGEIRAGLEGTLATDALKITKGTLRSDAVDGTFSGDVSLADGSITLKLGAEVVSAALPPGARPLLGDRLALSADLERDHSGNVSANALSVESGGLTASGSAKLSEGTIDADLKGTLADISPLAPQASGAVAVSATAKGPLAAPEIEANVTSERLGFGDRAIDDLDLRASGTVDLAAPQASVTLKGSFQGEAIGGKAVVATTDGKRELRDLDFSLGPNRISGQLSLDDKFTPAGTVTFDLPELSRLAALAGQTVEGAAKGSATFAEAGGVPQVKIALTSNSITREALTVSNIAVDATVSDYLKTPAIAGTVGATLAGLAPDQPPADLRLSVDGTIAAISGQGTLSMGGEAVTNFTVAHRMTDAGSQVEARGDGDFARFIPEAARKILGGKTNYDVAALLAKGGPITIERAEVSNGALTAKASGSYDPAGAVDISVQLGAGQSGLPLSFGTDEAPIDITVGSGTARISGPIAEPKLDIGANLSKVATNDVQLIDLGITLRSDKFNIASRLGAVTGSATAERLVIDNPTVAPLVAGEVRAQLDGLLETDALTVTNGILRSDAIDGAFGGKVSLKDGSITLKLKADVVSAALPAPVRPVLGPKLTLSTDLERDTEGNVSANSLALQSGGLTGSGVIRLSGGQIDADVKGALADISPLAQQASGAIAFAATAKGALATPDVTLAVTSDRMTVADRDIENLALNASAKADLANPQANVTLTGRVAGETLDGRAVLKSTDGRSEVGDLNLSLGKNRIVGALTLDQDFVPEGSIDFDLPDIGPLAALALETVEGSVRGKASFSRQGQAAQATVSLQSDSITRGDIVVRSVAVDAQISNYMVSPGVAGTVKAQEVRAGTTAVRGIDLKLSREDVWTRFSGGASVNDIPLKAAGRVKVENGTTTVELASAEATMRGIKAALARASTVSIAGGQTRLDNVALNVGGGSVTVSGTAGSSLNVNATLARIPASVVNAFAPGLDAGGTISGTVKATGAAANPAIAYTMEWSGAQTSQTRGAGVGALAIRSTGDFASNRLTFQANMSEGSGLALRGGGTVTLGGPPRLDLKFDGGVPFALVRRQLAAQGLALTGSANVNVTVTGAATAPVIGGNIRTSGARLVDAGTGIALNDIAADIALGGGRATISRASANLSTGGSVSASGSVGIDPASGFPGDIKVKLTDARYTDGEIVTTTMSGDLTVTGPLASAPKIGGTVNLSRTVIAIPARLPSSLTALDVRHKNATAAVKRQDQAMRPAQPSGGQSSGGLVLDLTVNAPQRIFVQGRGLDAELGGSLKLVGPAAAPRANGEFTMRRGRLMLLGRRLTFTRGTLGFTGSLVPTLDMAAETSTRDATITVAVSGPANNPKFSFTSVPALPEDEVLARLIFGQAMGNLSPLQIARLAEAAAELAGAGGTTGLLSSLREKLGVDDLDVKTNEDGSTAVSVGKHLNERTYVTIEQGDKAGSGRAAIDLDVGRGVKLRGEARDDGEAKGGIFFEREY
ncbi:translocation/assembly module TamB domain-containing protein [Mesorhizobium sp. LHD-90]|uniref:translocation/assembly module TamB domain-containing protein n=1 Tax=Mesorhizobium sp. LHD-90 TaxID=3071414 RepID=UPI0027E17E62|nr:translocation/assembly module TamB domain-containing protein [Mesorhizobium sp. LHD-90]MDQ6433376.1 translocation/assembly module TamB domain-containing protein [Mesorhizobium sp. LHD-90]